ncbi:hypothetical protein [Lactobacillus jensenii]|uniref:Holin n=1 Tax=Lactobacillus jensenii TaxID=109790 RepID=A0ABU9FJ17_LACJE|nr:hypothetical protein [Lactobacillus jensenii]DAR66725.1 MAG TPA: hypothetical protein [Caudoviricetes sp.]MCW8071743.1 hypothetical protein [Lactobacillus jensenii]MCW8089606.1 hypothetical protein [Lactobacillus jensenii]MDK8236088.1 hypothetical protein [Lactobacillus jensenii]MDT9544376.1 hypothetical protein [Lactobacillus jensenii]
MVKRETFAKIIFSQILLVIALIANLSLPLFSISDQNLLEALINILIIISLLWTTTVACKERDTNE